MGFSNGPFHTQGYISKLVISRVWPACFCRYEAGKFFFWPSRAVPVNRLRNGLFVVLEASELF
jgi:hypothetical protein